MYILSIMHIFPSIRLLIDLLAEKMIEIFAILFHPFPEQITIPIAQFVEKANESKGILIFYKVNSDVGKILEHF